MKLFERFAAAFAVLTASNFEAVEGKPELTEENVEALEAAATKVETLEAENLQLKGENQTHAERIAELETTVEGHAGTVATIYDALEANNMVPEDGTALGAHVAEKINAFGKTIPAATPVASTEGDDLNDAEGGETIYSEVDRRAHEAFNKKNK